MRKKENTIRLSEGFALILFELLNRIVSENKIDVSEEIVVNDLICSLEKDLPMLFSTNYQETLKETKKEVEKIWQL